LQHGFVSNATLPATKKDIDLGFSAALALETGFRFTLTGKIGLYTGLYFDYGLNSIQKTNDRHLLEYDRSNETVFKYSSVLNTGLTDKVNLLSTGLKIRISLNL
jgi:outer membrane protein assembly factor BamA